MRSDRNGEGGARASRASLLLALMIGACAHQGGSYVWVDALRDAEAPPAAQRYVISPGDLLNIRIYNQDGMSGRSRVRADGQISVPFLNDVAAAGLTTNELAARLEARLKDYLVKPVVTVALEEAKLMQVSVLGEVARPGTYPFEPGVGVLQALASAGGPSEFADKDRVFVLRQASAGGPPLRVRFTMRALVQAQGKAATFRLRSGDVVVVE